MKSIIKEILISQMSFPLKYKNEKEIWWEDEWGDPITIEIIDAENEQYIVRSYRNNGQLLYKINCHQGQKHGKYLLWHDNGKLCYRIDYSQGQWHGEYLEWYYNGKLWVKKNYHKGLLHGEYLLWHKNGKLKCKAKYNHGRIINEKYY